MAGGLDIYKDEGGGWSWRMVADNGEIIASGESYTERNDAIEGAARVAAAFARSLEAFDEQDDRPD